MYIIVWEYKRCLSQPGWVRWGEHCSQDRVRVKTEWYTGLFSQYTVLVSLLSASQLLIEDVPSLMTWLSMPSMWIRSFHILWTFLFLTVSLLNASASWLLICHFFLHFALQDFCSCFASAHRAPCIFHQSLFILHISTSLPFLSRSFF